MGEACPAYRRGATGRCRVGGVGCAHAGVEPYPLAEPGLLGVNSGAAASVVVGVAFLRCRPRSFSSGWRLAGSGLAAALVFVMGLVDSKPNLDSTARLVLTGVAVNACLGTITGIITMFNSKAFDSHRFWVVGSLENRTFEQVLSALPFVRVGLVLCLC